MFSGSNFYRFLPHSRSCIGVNKIWSPHALPLVWLFLHRLPVADDEKLPEIESTIFRRFVDRQTII